MFQKFKKIKFKQRWVKKVEDSEANRSAVSQIVLQEEDDVDNPTEYSNSGENTIPEIQQAN